MASHRLPRHRSGTAADGAHVSLCPDPFQGAASTDQPCSRARVNEPTQALPHTQPGAQQPPPSPLGKEKPANAACQNVPPARGWAARRFTLSVTHASNRVTRQEHYIHSNGVTLVLACPPHPLSSTLIHSSAPDARAGTWQWLVWRYRTRMRSTVRLWPTREGVQRCGPASRRVGRPSAAASPRPS